MMDGCYQSPVRQSQLYMGRNARNEFLKSYQDHNEKKQHCKAQKTKQVGLIRQKRRRYSESLNESVHVASCSTILEEMSAEDSVDMSTMECTPRRAKSAPNSDNEYMTLEAEQSTDFSISYSLINSGLSNSDKCYQTPRKKTSESTLQPADDASYHISQIYEEGSPHDCKSQSRLRDSSPLASMNSPRSPIFTTPNDVLSPHTPKHAAELSTSPPTPQAPLRIRKARRSLLSGIMNADVYAVKLALEAEDDPNAELCIPPSYRTFCRDSVCLPLLLGAMTYQANVLRVLLEYGAAVNSVNSRNQTAAHIICQPHLVKMTQSSCLSSDTSRQDDTSKNTLNEEVGSESARIESLSTLLHHRIDLSIVDSDGHTALDYAKNAALHQVVSFLQNRSDCDSNSEAIEHTPLKMTVNTLAPFPQLDHDLTPCEKVTRQRYYFTRGTQKTNLKSQGQNPELHQDQRVGIHQF